MFDLFYPATIPSWATGGVIPLGEVRLVLSSPAGLSYLLVI